MFTFSSLTDLVAALQAGGLSADTEAKSIQVPGVWVQPQRIERDTYGSSKVTGRLVLVVEDADPSLALDKLAELLDQVTLVYPAGAAALRTVLMPDGSRLPGLEVPFGVRALD